MYIIDKCHFINPDIYYAYTNLLVKQDPFLLLVRVNQSTTFSNDGSRWK